MTVHVLYGLQSSQARLRLNLIDRWRLRDWRPHGRRVKVDLLLGGAATHGKKGRQASDQEEAESADSLMHLRFYQQPTGNCVELPRSVHVPSSVQM